MCVLVGSLLVGSDPGLSSHNVALVTTAHAATKAAPCPSPHPCALPQVNLVDGFAGVYPEHKYAIVEAYQSHGRLVGMTGELGWGLGRIMRGMRWVEGVVCRL